MAQLTGKVTEIFPVVSGETEKGEWKRGGFAVETVDDRKTNVAFTLFGERRIDMISMEDIGTLVVVYYTPESRCYADKWYTDLQCTNILKTK